MTSGRRQGCRRARLGFARRGEEGAGACRFEHAIVTALGQIRETREAGSLALLPACCRRLDAVWLTQREVHVAAAEQAAGALLGGAGRQRLVQDQRRLRPPLRLDPHGAACC